MDDVSQTFSIIYSFSLNMSPEPFTRGLQCTIVWLLLLNSKKIGPWRNINDLGVECVDMNNLNAQGDWQCNPVYPAYPC